MTTPHKLGVLVAIPIKGRKLINRSGGKQSPYVQLKLGPEQKKRTRASLIASVEPEWDQEVRLDVFHGQLDMHVAVYDEGKKNELIGDGTLLLHEVVDKGELDVWFPIKYNGSPAGDIYFELTFYAAAPPPAAGSTPPVSQAQIQTPIRHTQPGFQSGLGMHGVPHTPPTSGFGSPAVGPPPPFAGNIYQPGYSATPRPFAPPQPFSPASTPYGGPPVSGPGFGAASPFRPPGASPYPTNTSPQFGNASAPGGGPYPNQMPQPFLSGPPGSNAFPTNNIANNNNMPPRFPVPQHSGPGFPQGPGGGPPNSFPNNGPNNNNFPHNGPPNSYPNNNFNNFNNGPNNFNNGPNHNNFGGNGGPNGNFGNNGNNFNNNNNNNFNNQNNFNNNNMSQNNRNNNLSTGGAPVTPLMQYNYNLESFP
ncbi:hypothetical protein BX616_004714 [Lobosporangium transversale]|uniref:C2 domain-containing protein n=1 Tax=Lobosporangium transversale TaxID=64571 RepID=A0A1Y2H1A9_9FUNG|nr:hypothetical protein BCR41DRAFT_345905 [Lobosporangium transversale]KAF9916059.1 hypothetical protein BX616_004714 [Lobosporangium transversale]ORZ27791.1 hypothetical protein BCR41DRAFT_345905 [Lobosporangium transversale]|eukprot:XP_021885494.1 hypothetical protein BCR41DRAFT_345905 [Lobosporangium transversale]